jgi:hypothetical protein
LNTRRWVPVCAFVLSVIPSLASADESLVGWARGCVERGIVNPLSEREHRTSIFSRARPAPRERRIRVLQATAIKDKSGRGFVPFAVDIRFTGGDWETDDIVGCVYAGKGDLYVKRGDGYRPAEFLFGKNADVVAGACEAAPSTPRDPRS